MTHDSLRIDHWVENYFIFHKDRLLSPAGIRLPAGDYAPSLNKEAIYFVALRDMRIPVPKARYATICRIFFINSNLNNIINRLQCSKVWDLLGSQLFLYFFWKNKFTSLLKMHTLNTLLYIQYFKFQKTI